MTAGEECERLREADTRLLGPEHEAAREAAWRVNVLRDQIWVMPARSPAGLAVQARVALHEADGGEHAIEDDVAALALARSVLALTGEART